MEAMQLSSEDEVEVDEWRCEYVRPNGERCLRVPDAFGIYCWQHPTRAAARARVNA